VTATVFGTEIARKNAPSRWLLRPTSRLTSAEATADRRAINLRRSVLGASRTLGRQGCPVKGIRRRGKGKARKLRTFLYAYADLPSALCALERKRVQEFAEPGALSSTPPSDLPLARTASRRGFILLASRARRRRDSMLTRAGEARGCRHGFTQIAKGWRRHGAKTRRCDGGRHGHRARTTRVVPSADGWRRVPTRGTSSSSRRSLPASAWPGTRATAPRRPGCSAS
jgi:hypothetical protein